MLGDVIRQPLLLGVVEDLDVEVGGLRVVVLVGGVVAGAVAGGGARVAAVFGLVLLRPGEGVGVVVGGAALVGVHHHGPVPVVVGRLGVEGAVDGDLHEVGAQPVAVGIVVREQPALDFPKLYFKSDLRRVLVVRTCSILSGLASIPGTMLLGE